MSKLQEIEAKAQGAIQTVVDAVSDLISRKNATDGAETTENADVREDEASPSVYAQTLKRLADEKRNAAPGPDPAHAPGHRKLGPDGGSVHAGAKVQPQASALNNNAKADVIHQTESEQRRNIPGASIERKGRRS